jgi:hypothetical protein
VPVRLDAILAGQAAVLTARRPEAALVDLCKRYGLLLLRIRAAAGPDEAPRDWIDVRLTGKGQPSDVLHALTADPGLAIIVRPDRVVAAVAVRCRPPEVPWSIRPHSSAQSAADATPSRTDPAVQAGH